MIAGARPYLAESGLCLLAVCLSVCRPAWLAGGWLVGGWAAEATEGSALQSNRQGLGPGQPAG